MKPIIKMCATCGKLFTTTNRMDRHCCRMCKLDEMLNGGQICWQCKNATGNCSWSKNLTPVRGWIAEPRVIRDYDNITHTHKEINTYKIRYCPQFAQESRINIRHRIRGGLID